MKRRYGYLAAALLAVLFLPGCRKARKDGGFTLTDAGYFRSCGVDVMAYDDTYPEGHQGGVSLIMHGKRIVSNGDLRLEATPGQWQPIPKQLSRSAEGNCIKVSLCYPDSSRHMTGFNPMIYPDLHIAYTVDVKAEGDHIEITVDLDKPVPRQFLGKVGFNMEFFPGWLTGKPWIMDSETGIYPPQPNSPLTEEIPNKDYTWEWRPEGASLSDLERLTGGNSYNPFVADDIIAEPYAVGRKFTSRPDDPYQKVTIESKTADLKLYDGRMNHNNGWFVLRSEIPEGATKGAVKWVITPSVVKDWTAPPVVQTSQVGYFTFQNKAAVVELDQRAEVLDKADVVRIDEDKELTVKTVKPFKWGKFLRYNYLKVDFSDITEPGLYKVVYGESSSPIFRISDDVFDRGVWQPVVEYFLPVQMCHMKVSEKYRVWHGLCHMDDALMAPEGNHIDGYVQEAGTSRFAPGMRVHGLTVGGWHDAGDYDIRIESQAEEAYVLSLAWEAFHPEIDVTSIDQDARITEIHQPDGKNDILQQIENGALSIVSGYNSLGKLYRGIISHNPRQYVLLGDASTMTDGVSGDAEDRWVFTENNPSRELSAAACLAGISRALGGFNDPLSEQCLAIAEAIFRGITPAKSDKALMELKAQAAAELFLATEKADYSNFLLDNIAAAVSSQNAWRMARVERKFSTMPDPRALDFCDVFKRTLDIYSEEVKSQIAQTPYGVPYKPSVWGAGWDIQRFAFKHWFLVDAYPSRFSAEPIYDAVNFVLGCHPGSNRSSFASGVGAESATVAYGANRADWSYIPGGVVSGTGLIRPDYPELLEFPYIWQQSEYCLGGASSHYMFIVLAVRHLQGR